MLAYCVVLIVAMDSDVGPYMPPNPYPYECS